MSNRREREYAKRRYEHWQHKQAERARRQQTVKRTALTAVAAVVGVLAVVGVVVAVTGEDGGQPVATAAMASSSASNSASAGPTAVDNPCPKPGSAAVANPKSWRTAPDASLAQGKSWRLVLDTTCGAIIVDLDGAKAPKAVASTLFLARNGFWNGSPCHRLTNKGIFVLQCGDPTGIGTGGPGYSYGPVENAPSNDVYPAGTVAMARQQDKGNSMGSQFFLVYKDSTIPSDSAGGYSVIGKVVGGMDVVEKVAAGGVIPGGGESPVRAISITSTAVAVK